MGWLSDPWVVGIGGGVLSGLVVALISRYLLGKRENREYVQKVIAANLELVYAIRSGIPEGTIPAREVVDALTNATARKYGVSATDLYGPAEIAEELTKEIMDSSFISSGKKAEYCTQLAALAQPPLPPVPSAPQPPPATAEVPSFTLSEYRRRSTTMISILAGILTMTMTAMVAGLEAIRGERLWGLRELFGLLLPAVVVLISVLMTMYAYMLLRQTVRRRIEAATFRPLFAVRNVAGERPRAEEKRDAHSGSSTGLTGRSS